MNIFVISFLEVFESGGDRRQLRERKQAVSANASGYIENTWEKIALRFFKRT